jgi:AcrR family transcriptional regulator
MTAAALQPRKTPRQGRAQAMVEAIVEAAARILETAGPDGFNTNAVAARAGVSVGSLYQYFPGKQALVAELSRRNAQAVLEGLGELAATTEGQPVRARLGAFVAFAVRQQSARPRLSRVLDQLEEDLSLDTDARASTPAIVAILAPVLADAAPSLSVDALSAMANDCVALTRALIDSALERGGVNPIELQNRAVGALMGFLGAISERPRSETAPN